MRIEKRTFDGIVILTFIGEFDEESRQKVFDKIDTLIESGHVQLAFNLRLLKYINSTSIGALNAARARAVEAGGDVVLVQPSRFVQRVLGSLGLVELFKIFESDVDAIRYFHTGILDDAIDLSTLPVETEEDILGSGALIFRLLDAPAEAAPARGAVHSVGHITGLYKDGPLFRWTIPASGEASGSGIDVENFDQLVHEGTRLAIKFRQPLAMKSRFVRGEARVTNVARESSESGAEEATIRLEYTSLDPDVRELLDRHVEQLDALRNLAGPK